MSETIQYQKGKNTLEIDSREFTAMLDRLTDVREVRNIAKRGIRAGARVTMRAVEANFANLRRKNARRASANTGDTHRKKWVSLKVMDTRQDKLPMGVLSIMSRNVKPQARIFEGGTADRYRRHYRINWVKGDRGWRKRATGGHGVLRKPQYTGRIIRGDYFERALQSTENQAFRQIFLSANHFIINAANKRW